MTSDAQPLPQDPHADEDPRLWISALADGDAQALDSACAHWRDDEGARRAWHAYHLIGDVMRSDELARPVARDADFLSGLRARLASEPVVLAPVAHARRRPWMLPAAAAASIVAVAGVLMVARMGGLGWADGGPALASASNAAPAALLPGRQLVRDQGLIRDARLDEFLRAHQAAGGVGVAAPGGALRRVDITVPVGPDR